MKNKIFILVACNLISLFSSNCFSLSEWKQDTYNDFFFGDFVNLTLHQHNNIITLSQKLEISTPNSKNISLSPSWDSYTPSMAIDHTQNIHIVWYENMSTSVEIFYSKIDKYGNVLTDRKRLTFGGYSMKPRIAIDSANNVHICWMDRRSGRQEIHYLKMDQNSNIIVNDKKISSGVAWSVYPSLAIDKNDNIHLVWGDNRNSFYIWKPYYAKLDNNGNILVPDKLISNFECSAPEIASNSSNELYIMLGGIFLKTDNNGNVIIGEKDFGLKYVEYVSNLLVNNNDELNVVLNYYRCEFVPQEVRVGRLNYLRVDKDGNIKTIKTFIEDIGDDETGDKTSPWISFDSYGDLHITYYDATRFFYTKIDNFGNILIPRYQIPGGSYYSIITVDSDNFIHIIWNEGWPGEIFYSRYFNSYLSTGTFTSSPFDTNSSVTRFNKISWIPISQPIDTEIKFQIATNNDNSTWSFLGPDGTGNSYYTLANGQSIWTGHSGSRYIKYKAFFNTANTSVTPVLDDITIIYNRPTQAPTLVSPTNGVWTNATPTLVWDVPTDADGDNLHFKVEISSVPGFSVSNVYESKVDTTGFNPVPPIAQGGGTCSYTIQPADSLFETTYYWRVSAWDGCVYGPYSDVWSFVVDTIPPTVPVVNPEPVYTKWTQNNISWSASTDNLSGVSGYLAECSTNALFSTVTSASDWITYSSYTFTNLSDGVTYYYRVKAKDNAGNESGWSNVVWSTQDNSAPNIKILAPIGTILAGLNTIMVQSINEPLPSTPTVKITLNGAEPQDITLLLSTTDQGYTWSCLYTIPKENKGEGYLEVRAIDRVGYLGYSTGTFIVVSGAVKGIEVFNLSDIPDPYIPDGITLATFTYTIDKQNPYTVQWSSLTIFDPFDNFVKQYTKTSSLTYPITYNEFWDGKNMTNNFVGDGIYHYQVNAGGIRRKGTSTLSVEASTKTATITILKRINFTFVPVTTYTNPSNPTFIITPMTSSDTARVFGISSVTMDRIIGAAYRIEPSSVIISPAATLTLYYDDLPLGGINPVDLRIYRFEPGQPPVIISNATDVDIVNKKITVHLDRLSTFAILSPGAIFIPPEKIDTTPPTFAVNLTFDSEKTDEITVTVTASEKLQAPPNVTVYPHGKSEKKLPINVDVTLVEGTKTIYTGTFTRITGFGDIDKVIVIGKDLAGNIGISDGTFTKNVISSTGGIVKDSKGKGITVDIPDGAIQEQIIITIKEEDQNNALVENEKTNSANKCNLKRVGKGYKFGPDGTQFAKPVTITIPYTGENVKNTDLTKLKIACWNESKNNWDIVKNSKVYPQENKTTAEIMHFSVYQIVIQQEPDSAFKLGEIYSYPNPAKGGIQPILHIEVGLADRIEIMVYNIAAELVHSTELMGTTWKIIDNKYCYEYTWNASGVASGVYIYMVRAKKGNETIKVLKKLAIIR